MKRFCLCTMLLLLSFLSVAQRNRATHFAELMIGTAHPMGDFGQGVFRKENFYNNRSAGAKTGNAFMLSYGRVWNERYGYEIALPISLNPLIDPFDYTFRNWTNFALLMGPFYSIPVTELLWMDIRLLGGVMFTKRPTMLLDISNPDGVLLESFFNEGADGYSPTVLLGFGLRLKLTDIFDLKLAADLGFANPKLNYNTLEWTGYYDIFGPVYAILVNHEHKQKINIANISFGLVIHRY